MIGLVDFDVLTDKRKFFPNLELMKISSYFKSKNEVVQLLTNAKNIDLYERVYIQKDDLAEPYPIRSTSLPNVRLGGLAYTNNKYIPLKPEIDKMQPDFSIYRNFLRNNRNKIITQVKAGKLLMEGANFLRLSNNNIIDPTQLLHPDKLNVIYDIDVAAKENFFDWLDYQFSERVKYISFVNPVRLHSEDELSKVFISSNYGLSSKIRIDLENINFGNIIDALVRTCGTHSCKLIVDVDGTNYTNFESQAFLLRKLFFLFFILKSTPDKKFAFAAKNFPEDFNGRMCAFFAEAIGGKNNTNFAEGDKKTKTFYQLLTEKKFLKKSHIRDLYTYVEKLRHEDSFLYNLIMQPLLKSIENYRRREYNGEFIRTRDCDYQ